LLALPAGENSLKVKGIFSSTPFKEPSDKSLVFLFAMNLFFNKLDRIVALPHPLIIRSGLISISPSL